MNAEAYATYGMPPEVLVDVFDEPGAVLEDPAATIVVARRADQPVATAMVYESDGVASLQWVGTVPAERRTGLGALVTVMADEPGLRPRSIVVLAAGVTDGCVRLSPARLRDDVPLRGIRPLAQAEGPLTGLPLRGDRRLDAGLWTRTDPLLRHVLRRPFGERVRGVWAVRRRA